MKAGSLSNFHRTTAIVEIVIWGWKISSYSFSVISAAQKLKAVDAVDVLCILYLLHGWYVAKYLDCVPEKSDFKGIILHAALLTQSGGLLIMWGRRRLLTTFLPLGTNQPVIKKLLDNTAMTAPLPSGCRLKTFAYIDDEFKRFNIYFLYILTRFRLATVFDELVEWESIINYTQLLFTHRVVRILVNVTHNMSFLVNSILYHLKTWSWREITHENPIGEDFDAKETWLRASPISSTFEGTDDVSISRNV